MDARQRSETVDATQARANLGDILARARYGGWRFVILQRGEPAAVVMGYDDYRGLMGLLEDVEDVPVAREPEEGPIRQLREHLSDDDDLEEPE